MSVRLAVPALALALAGAACRDAAQANTVSYATPPWVALLPGDTLRLSGTRSAGERWRSSDPAVASVTRNGLVRGAAPGTAVITLHGTRGVARATVVVAPPVVVGAGDIAGCDEPGDEATARLLDSIPGIIFTAGDNAYPNGRVEDFANCYAPTWGRHRERTRPSPGNHDWRTADGAPYFAYFGVQAGDSGVGYYSWDFAGWHFISLNSNIATEPGSPQERWLRADLARHRARCTLAYWHHPRFSSAQHGDDDDVDPLWRALYEAGADVVVGGHDHAYERFAPQTPDAAADPARGIRQFVVGTGGRDHYDFEEIRPNSEVRDNTSLGVLVLRLEPAGYRWRFVAAEGGTFADEGVGACH